MGRLKVQQGLPKLRKKPMWVPTTNDETAFAWGVFKTRRDATDEAICVIGDHGATPGARKVWIAVEGES